MTGLFCCATAHRLPRVPSGMRLFHKVGGGTVSVLPSEIASVEPTAAGCRVLLCSGAQYELRESAEDVQGAVRAPYAVPGIIER